MSRTYLLIMFCAVSYWNLTAVSHALESDVEPGQVVTVFLREGKRVDGVILGFVDGRYRIRVDGKVVEIRVEDVRVIIFDREREKGPGEGEKGKAGRGEGPAFGIKSPKVLRFWMDAKGQLFDKPLDGGDVRPGKELLRRVLVWDEMAKILVQAANASPQDKDLPVHDHYRKPLKFSLRLDEGSGKLSHYVGDTYCGEGTGGLLAANRMIEDHKSKGRGFFYLDFHASGVAASWVIQTLWLVHGHKPASVFYTGGILKSELAASVKSAVEFAGGASKTHRDVTVECVVHKDAPYEPMAGLMLMCAHMGIRKVYLGLSEKRMLKTFLHVDQGLKPMTKEVDVPEPFTERFGGKRNLRAFGGGRHTESAVLMGLIWLKNHQNPDGLWSCRNFMFNCKKGKCTGAGSGGQGDFDIGVTGLAVMAFLGGGHTSIHGKFQMQVEKGLTALMAHQDADGCFGTRDGSGHWIYNHAVCTLAMSEAYGLTRDKRMHSSAQRAVDFLVSCQNPYLGWRYGVRTGENDSSCTAWAVSALHSAALSGLKVPKESFQGALNWYDKVTDEAYYKTGYSSKGDNGARLMAAVGKFQSNDSMTAAAVISRILILGTRAKNRPEVLGGGNLLKQNPPKWDVKGGTIDMYFWYWGTQAMFQLGRQYWKAWNGPLKNALVPTQNRRGCENGSWDPSGAWGSAGGRVYATAINVLSLEVYYRYAKVFPNPPGSSSHPNRGADPAYEGVLKRVLELVSKKQWEGARKVIEAAMDQWRGGQPERTARLRSLWNDLDLWERNWKRKKAAEEQSQKVSKAVKSVPLLKWTGMVGSPGEFNANWKKVGTVECGDDGIVSIKGDGAYTLSAFRNSDRWIDYEIEFEVQSNTACDLGVRAGHLKKNGVSALLKAFPLWTKIRVELEGVTLVFYQNGKTVGSQPVELGSGGIFLRCRGEGTVKLRNLKIKLNRVRK
ncbi:MAG: prenyltransferase/squalene oxidase repeat-containing protein [Planctomycetota bacterium]